MAINVSDLGEYALCTIWEYDGELWSLPNRGVGKFVNWEISVL